jgi:2-polyprenyl-3-methyl-5-hydroxy-6-metoxy-1,4-benzoquinol methylase
MHNKTKESFDYQWGNLLINYTREELIKHRDQICEFSQLPKRWFKGKTAIDVGCGGGRYTWGLCDLGCEVTAIDQSENALRTTQRLCNAGTVKHDILHPFKVTPRFEGFDFVWCFGVVHHTGDTFRALKNVTSLVKKGGYLFLMIYGVPTTPEGAREVNKYEMLREKVKKMTFEEREKYIKENISKEPKKLHGYFDAISTETNDLYDFEEIREWLEAEGFSCKLTSDNRNHRIIAKWI